MSPAASSTSSSARRIPGLLRLCAGLLVLGLLLGACDGGDDASGTATPGSSGDEVKATATTATGSNPTSTAAPGRSDVRDEPLRFAVSDGTEVQGHLYTVPGPNQKIVIIAHGAGENQNDWKAYAQELVGPGFATFTFDFPRSGNDINYQLAQSALNTAVGLIRSREYPLIYVLGSGAGGTAALKVAAAHELTSLILVSTPVTAGNLSAANDFGAVSEPKLFVFGQSDSSAQETYDRMQNTSPGVKQILVVQNTADKGVKLFTGASANQVKDGVNIFLGR